MQDIFVFERKGLGEGGKVRGVFKSTGIRAKFTDRLAAAGCRVRPAVFESVVEV